MPSFSIITPTFNSEKTLPDTIRAVINQTMHPKEYIIVDGISTDQTLSTAESFRPTFEEKGITFIVISEKDNGIYDAMNKGIYRASGDIIGIINSDDWYQPNTLEFVADTFNKTNFDMMFGDMLVHTKNKTLLKRAGMTPWITSRNWNHPTTFTRREIHIQYPYPCQSIYDDFNMYVKMRKEKKNIVALNKTLANFRIGGVSTRRSWSEVIRRTKIRYKIYRQNGHSRLYVFECILVEVVKYFLS